MARFYRASDDRLDETIRDAEKRLDALYLKRAGRRNSMQGQPLMGWTYCACGRTNQPNDYQGCERCKLDAECAASVAMMRAHDAGEHTIAPVPTCVACYAQKISVAS